MKKGTWNDWLLWGQTQLESANIIDAKLDAWYLMEAIFQISRMEFLMARMQPREISEELYLQYQVAVQRRAEHIPLQYILHQQEFMGFSFYVDEAVLIPRQDTETLVEEILKDEAQYTQKEKTVIDMGTGSGCIAVALAKMGKFSKVSAVDVSQKALEVAKKNAAQLSANVYFCQSDWFEQIPEEKQYDVIVSNPPYIREDERENLMPEVEAHEPSLALFAREQGLACYRILVREGVKRLKSGGRIYFEIGCEQAKAVSDLLRQFGYRDITVKQDLAGLDRVVKAHR